MKDTSPLSSPMPQNKKKCAKGINRNLVRALSWTDSNVFWDENFNFWVHILDKRKKTGHCVVLESHGSIICCRKVGETEDWNGGHLKDSSRLWRLLLPFQMQSILKFLLKIHTGESFFATVRGKLSYNIPNSILYCASRKDFHIF